MLVRQFSLAFFCLYVIHFVLLIDPNKQSMAQDKKEEVSDLTDLNLNLSEFYFV